LPQITNFATNHQLCHKSPTLPQMEPIPKPKIKLKDVVRRPDNEQNLEKLDIYKTNKNTLKNILKQTVERQNIEYLILDGVNRTNQIVIHTYQFLKLYLIWCTDQKRVFPRIDQHFLEVCMRVVSQKKDRRGGQSSPETLQLMKELQDFFQKHYQPLLADQLPFSTNLGIILKYEAITMITNIENNIKTHYVNHLNSFINFDFRITEQIKELERERLSHSEIKQMRKAIYDCYRLVKQDLLNVELIDSSQYQSDPQFHEWISEMKSIVLPQKLRFEKNNIHYD
jgi:hypothetical protein